MHQWAKNKLVMQVAGAGFVFWLFLLCAGSHSDSDALRWHQQMHWLDKLAWYVGMAIGPALMGLIAGVAIGGRKVIAKCMDCGGKYDADTMKWGLFDPTSHTGSWRCQKCCDRYERWNEWRQRQENKYSYRNEEEKQWARRLWESDPGYMLEDVLWRGPDGKGFPAEPVNSKRL
jgi:hypothetical protein